MTNFWTIPSFTEANFTSVDWTSMSVHSFTTSPKFSYGAWGGGCIWKGHGYVIWTGGVTGGYPNFDESHLTLFDFTTVQSNSL